MLLDQNTCASFKVSPNFRKVKMVKNAKTCRRDLCFLEVRKNGFHSS